MWGPGKRVGVVPAALAGLFVGAVPYAAYSFPYDATLRAEPWVMDWLQELAVFGVLGVVGALAFVVVYRTTSQTASNHRSSTNVP